MTVQRGHRAVAPGHLLRHPRGCRTGELAVSDTGTGTDPAQSDPKRRGGFDPACQVRGRSVAMVAGASVQSSRRRSPASSRPKRFRYWRTKHPDPAGTCYRFPVDGADPTVASLKGDIRNAGGKVLLVESASGAGWGDADSGTNRGGWEPRRFGATPPAPVVALLEAARLEVLSACGVPPSLFLDADGTGQRESYRRFLHTTLTPLARLVESEASRRARSTDQAQPRRHLCRGRAGGGRERFNP